MDLHFDNYHSGSENIMQCSFRPKSSQGMESQQTRLLDKACRLLVYYGQVVPSNASEQDDEQQ